MNTRKNTSACTNNTHTHSNSLYEREVSSLVVEARNGVSMFHRVAYSVQIFASCQAHLVKPAAKQHLQIHTASHLWSNNTYRFTQRHTYGQTTPTDSHSVTPMVKPHLQIHTASHLRLNGRHHTEPDPSPNCQHCYLCIKLRRSCH